MLRIYADYRVYRGSTAREKDSQIRRRRINPKPPPRANSPPPESVIIYDECLLPSADDPASLLILRCICDISLMMLRRTGYIFDADRSTLSFDPEALEGRLSTGYPIDLSRRSSTCLVVAERQA